MLPLITEDIRQLVVNEALQDVGGWRKKMIHYIKEENPEVNAAIIDAAQTTNLDPKSIALGAYLTYILLEKADKAEASFVDDILD